MIIQNQIMMQQMKLPIIPLLAPLLANFGKKSTNTKIYLD